MHLGGMEAMKLAENGWQVIRLRVVEQCPRADQINAMFQQKLFDIGMLPHLANCPGGEASGTGLKRFQDVPTKRLVGYRVESGIVIQGEGKQIVDLKAVVGAELTHKTFASMGDRVGEITAQAELSFWLGTGKQVALDAIVIQSGRVKVGKLGLKKRSRKWLNDRLIATVAAKFEHCPVFRKR